MLKKQTSHGLRSFSLIQQKYLAVLLKKTYGIDSIFCKESYNPCIKKTQKGKL